MGDAEAVPQRRHGATRGPRVLLSPRTTLVRICGVGGDFKSDAASRSWVADMGRNKIKIEPIKNERNRQVRPCFFLMR